MREVQDQRVTKLNGKNLSGKKDYMKDGDDGWLNRQSLFATNATIMLELGTSETYKCDF